MNAAARIVCGLKNMTTSPATCETRYTGFAFRNEWRSGYVYPHLNLFLAATEFCNLVAPSEPRRRLRSAAVSALILPWVTTSFGDRPSHTLDLAHGTIFHHSSEPKRLYLNPRVTTCAIDHMIGLSLSANVHYSGIHFFVCFMNILTYLTDYVLSSTSNFPNS